MIIDELIAILGFDVRGEGDLDRFNRGLNRGENAARGFSATLGRLAVAAAGAMASLAIGQRLAGFVTEITRVNASFEKMEATLRTIEGSAQKASAAMDWIKEFGATTPYEVNELTAAFVRMRAYGLDPMDGSFKALGDAAAAMGKPFMSAVEAMADAVTGENERLKEFGIRSKVAGDQITYSWEENGKTLTKTVSKNGQEISRALTEIFGRFEGAMAGQNKAWDGMVSNMLDRWTFFLLKIGEKGYYDDIKRRLQGVLDTLSRWASDGTLDRAAGAISDFLTTGMEIAEQLGRSAWRIGSGFYHAADAVLTLGSRITGLSKTMTAAGLGALILGSTAIGKRAILAVASRVPWLAALLVLDDLVGGLNGDSSYIGGLEGGQDALDAVRKNFEELNGAANELAGTLNRIFGIDAGEGSELDAFLMALSEFANRELVRFVRELAETIQTVAEALETINWVLQNPDEAWRNFADAAIEQIDRIIQAIDERLGGALTRFGFLGPAMVTQDPASPYPPVDQEKVQKFQDNFPPPYKAPGDRYTGSPAHGAEGARGGFYGPGMADQIRRGAGVLGISPEDLATVISYETGGTFDPWQRGPRTKWGRHRGLIQMGEPQRKKYGYRQGDSLEKQMDAVVAYLQDAGVKPGMGTLPVYSAINAGGIGEKYYRRRDAAAGGAPGTVRDKVNNQMAGHRRKARSLLAEPSSVGIAANYEGNMARIGDRSLQATVANNNSRSSQVNQTINVGDVHAAPGERVDKATARAIGNAAASGGVRPVARIQADPAVAP